MWVYQYLNGQYEVGFYDPGGEWNCIEIYDEQYLAFSSVCSLNGG